MGGKLSKVDKIINAIRVVKDIDKEYRYDVESILYAFASKFLKEKDLEKVKEELRVTELGKSLIEEGIEKGKAEGKVEAVIRLLMKKFKKIPVQYTEKIKTLPEESLDLIITEIFAMNSINELEQYF